MTKSEPDVRRRRAPRSLNVVWDPEPEEIGAEVDWSSWYLTDEEDMGEGGEQEQIIWALKSALLELARERGWERVHIGADQFFAWMPSEPLVRVSPDVYLLDDPPKRPFPPSWQTWLPGHRPPRLAVEIVSGDSWKKDYRENPPKYAQLGATELVIFDPEAATGCASTEERIPLQVFRREADGGFVRAFHGAEPARSEVLDAWLVVRQEGDTAWLAVALDPQGHNLVSTLEEARDEEHARRRAAEERAATLEEELDRLRRERDE
jgi:Uma2 family endonuclease